MVIIHGLNIQHKIVLWYVADFSDRKPINFTTEYTGEYMNFKIIRMYMTLYLYSPARGPLGSTMRAQRV